MSKLAAAFEDGAFVVTSELNPPKGTDLEPLLIKADLLKDQVAAVNITDSANARMAMAPLAVGHLLLDRGIEPIVQMTTRDRNRIALQGDLLAASALGITNIVVMGGDSPAAGDHAEAKPVFDLYAADLLRAARSLGVGRDLGGNPLSGPAEFCLGAVVNPGAPDLDGELRRMEQKIEAGATFFQTQAVFDLTQFERFAEAVATFKTRLLAGIIMLKSVKMAQNINDGLPGVAVPKELIGELAAAKDQSQASVAIAARTINAIKPLCQGAHIMALGWEALIPQVVRAIA